MRRHSGFFPAIFCGLLTIAALNPPAVFGQSAVSASTNAAPARKRSPLLDYKFTNELGQPVSISDFRGQALAVTFFFSRCPMPEYCPRLSKNFQEASRILSTNENGFTNWHFLSMTFDPAFDTPEVLKAYGQRYDYDSNHWSFLTGPKDKIDEFARQSGIKADPEGGLINHNFRTLIVDPSGHLQMVFPMVGDLSEAIATEMKKAGGFTNASTQKRTTDFTDSTDKKIPIRDNP